MPLQWVSLAFLTGLGTGLTSRLSFWIVLLLFAIASTLLAGEVRLKPAWTWRTTAVRAAGLPMAALLVAFAAGLAWMSWHQQPDTPNDLSYYARGDRWQVTGQVINMPQHAARGLVARIQVAQISRELSGPAIPVKGIAQVTLPADTRLSYGDALSVTAKLIRPRAGASTGYANYLKAKGVTALMLTPDRLVVSPGQGNPLLEAVYDLRLRAYRLVNQLYPQPAASLVAGILLGMDEAMPAAVEDDFRDSGLSHIIAISGFNIALLAGVLNALFRRWLAHWHALLATLIGLSFYTLLAGGEPSVVRAAVMGSIGLIGVSIGRQQSGTNSLAFTAAVMAALHPNVLLDVGFQLSFMATLGLVLFATTWRESLEGWLALRWPAERARLMAGIIGEYLLVTLAAQLLTLPLIAFHFNRISLTSLLSNPLALPAQPLLMILGGLSVLAGLLFTWAGQVFAWLALPLAEYTIRIAQIFGAPAQSSLEVPAFPVSLLFAIYAGMALVYFQRARWANWRRHLKPSFVVIALFLMTAATWTQVWAQPDGKLHLRLISRQEGMLVLLQSPQGTRVILSDQPMTPAHLQDEIADGRWAEAAFVYTGSQRAWAQSEEGQAGSMGWAQLILPARIGEEASVDCPTCTTMSMGEQLVLPGGVEVRIELATRLGSAVSVHFGDLTLLMPGPFLAETLVPYTPDLQPLTLIAHRQTTAEGLDAFRQRYTPQFQIAPATEMAPPEVIELDGSVEIVSDGRQMWFYASD